MKESKLIVFLFTNKIFCNKFSILTKCASLRHFEKRVEFERKIVFKKLRFFALSRSCGVLLILPSIRFS